MTYSRLLRSTLCCMLLFTTGVFASGMPEAGSPAPDFKLTSQSGSQVSLKAYKGSWIVLFFFGDHSSSDMGTSARNLQRDMAKYASFNAQIIGIGRTSAESNLEWAQKNGITFPLLSDPDQKIANAYGVPAGGSNSTTDGGLYQVILTPDGKVQLPGIVTFDVDGQSSRVLACLQYFKDEQK